MASTSRLRLLGPFVDLIWLPSIHIKFVTSGFGVLSYYT